MQTSSSYRCLPLLCENHFSVNTSVPAIRGFLFTASPARGMQPSLLQFLQFLSIPFLRVYRSLIGKAMVSECSTDRDIFTLSHSFLRQDNRRLVTRCAALGNRSIPVM